MNWMLLISILALLTIAYYAWYFMVVNKKTTTEPIVVNFKPKQQNAPLIGGIIEDDFSSIESNKETLLEEKNKTLINNSKNIINFENENITILGETSDNYIENDEISTDVEDNLIEFGVDNSSVTIDPNVEKLMEDIFSTQNVENENETSNKIDNDIVINENKISEGSDEIKNLFTD